MGVGWGLGWVQTVSTFGLVVNMRESHKIWGASSPVFYFTRSEVGGVKSGNCLVPGRAETHKDPGPTVASITTDIGVLFGKIDGPGGGLNHQVNQAPLFFNQINQEGHL